MRKIPNDKEIIEFLKAAGLRATRQRVAIGQQLFLSEDRHNMSVIITIVGDEQKRLMSRLNEFLA